MGLGAKPLFVIIIPLIRSKRLMEGMDWKLELSPSRVLTSLVSSSYVEINGRVLGDGDRVAGRCNVALSTDKH